jgi:TetR/AcrR family transcriptional regulator, mexJK operon transcriptional repressor
VPSTAQAVPLFAPVPRGEKRRREIAAVAQRVFFETGFADTTMQAIAVRAGASKETLYRHFGSKEDLFAEIVASRARCFLDHLDERFDQPGAVAEVLRSFGAKILEAMMEPDAIALCRVVIAETARNAEIGRVFLAAGPDRVRRRLAEFLSAATDRGELACREPINAARIFLGAVMANFHLNRLIAQNPGLGAGDIQGHVDEVVAMFMRQYATEPQPT